MIGSLYIVATPIGNLNDISARAITTLRNMDFIAAEDTRYSSRLLKHFLITTPMQAYHEHNIQQMTAQIIEQLQQGKRIALISDAGTPLINDPGYKLVSAAHDNHIDVIPVPGACAAIVALSASGLVTDQFIYQGYLPAKQETRKKMLIKCQYETKTMIFYETPHRIKASIEDMCEILGEWRFACIARELTKQYEQIVRANLATLLKQIGDETIKIKGEFVVIVEGNTDDVETDDEELLRIHQILSKKLSLKDAAALTAKITDSKKNEVYKLALENQNLEQQENNKQ